ncbi:uncharacterized protein LOC123686454 [Harmonia axyridis]|uniref:uncharacterized protein LOC123686454 n=1 Tax=Harmonia axyridis TaxID=115357 RepID=UPI001E274F91|nr:uncharacterized protein LOC123686454 [Harmonia axyridis]
MDVNRLLNDELTYELQLRGQVIIPSTVMLKRSLLRQVLKLNLPLQPTGMNPTLDIESCQNKLTDLLEAIQHFDTENTTKEYTRISTRLIHIQRRLNFIITKNETESQMIEHLKETAARALSSLEATLTADRQQPSTRPDGSLLEAEIPQSPEMSPIQPTKVAQLKTSLIDLEDDELPLPTAQVSHTATPANKSRLVQVLNETRQECEKLLQNLPTMPIPQPQQPNMNQPEAPTHSRWTSSMRRVSFPDLNEPVMNLNQLMTPTTAQQESKPRPMPTSTIPIHKWNIYFDGTDSVIGFIEEIERLAESRKTSLEHVFESIYELLRKDAKDWFIPRRGLFRNWDDFKTQLKEAFLPVNYEENLLDEIKKRMQGPDEKLLLYVTRMQNLFQKLTCNRPTEDEQIRLIRQRLLPSLQQALAFQETTTYDELLKKGKVFEMVQWQMGHYTKPPVKPSLIDEPHLTYHQRRQQDYPANLSAISENTRQRNHSTRQEAPTPSPSPKKGPSRPLTTARRIEDWNCSVSPGPDRPHLPSRPPEYSTNRTGNANTSQDRNGSPPERRVSSQTQCFRCGGYGHLRRDCRGTPKMFCSRCQRENILSRDCPCPQNRRGTTPSTSAGLLTTVIPIVSNDSWPLVEVHIEGKLFHALIDTGAAKSCCSQRVAQLCERNGIKGEKSTTEAVMVANGQTTAIPKMYHLGMVIADYALKNIEFLLVPNLPVDLILGIEMLKTYNFSLDIKNTECYLEGRRIPRAKQVSQEVIEVQTPEKHLQNRRGSHNKPVDSLLRNPLPTLNCVQLKETGIQCKWYKNKFQEVEKGPEHCPEYSISNGRLHRHFWDSSDAREAGTGHPWKLCIPTEQRTKVLKENHDSALAGHLGIAKMIAKISRNYYWPGMFRDIAKYVRNCTSCQKFKVPQQQLAGKMQPRKMVDAQFKEVPVLGRRTTTEMRMPRTPQSSVSSVQGRNTLARVERVVKRTTTQSTQTPPLCQLRTNQTTPAPRSVRIVGTMGNKVYLEVRPNTCWKCGKTCPSRQECRGPPLLFCSRCGLIGTQTRYCECVPRKLAPRPTATRSEQPALRPCARCTEREATQRREERASK